MLTHIQLFRKSQLLQCANIKEPKQIEIFVNAARFNLHEITAYYQRVGV